jgi:NSS family neurotransmitter:Na+ symporter
MAEQAQQQPRAQWGSKVGFILAAAGSAIGLGNIWKFPYITGENGGGLFVLIYLVCIALVGIPIMMAEIMIGRAAQKQPVAAFHTLQGRRTAWAAVGWMGVVAGFIICSYYIVVAGWAMDYTLKSIVNFTKPIHDQAAVAASEYRATTSVEDMRQTLIEQRVAHETRPMIAAIRAEAPPSVWRDEARFHAALSAADGSAEGRSRLLADPRLAEHVRIAEGLNERVAQALAAARAQAASDFESLDEPSILEQAETIYRRSVTFDRVNETFGTVATDGWTSAFWALIFMAITTLIVARGISSGIEAACKFMMPALFLLIIIMVIYGAFKPGFGEALSFVFKPDAAKLKASGVLEALGHSFFTLSLGMGAMITYGSYQKSKDGLASQSITIAGLDTLISLLACMMIFPIVFSYGQEPSAGPGLVFKSMPLAFAEIGRGGMLLAIMFFGLLVFAALTSSISLLEVVGSYFMDERNWPRAKAAWVIGGVIFLLSIPSAFSNDPDMAMSGWSASFGQTFFDTMDYLASNWMLPLGGLFISIYAGWVMPRRLREAEVEGLAPALFMGWLLLVRFIAPALVIVVLMQKVGILDADEIFHTVFS